MRPSIRAVWLFPLSLSLSAPAETSQRYVASADLTEVSARNGDQRFILRAKLDPEPSTLVGGRFMVAARLDSGASSNSGAGAGACNVVVDVVFQDGFEVLPLSMQREPSP